jgi:hypothetical protein
VAGALLLLETDSQEEEWSVSIFATISEISIITKKQRFEILLICQCALV